MTKLDPSHKEISYRWPFFLPDDDHFLYLIWSADPQFSGLYVSSIHSSLKKRLLSDESRVEYAPPGFLIYVHQGKLMAQSFDAKSLELKGEALPIAEKVKYEGYRRYAPFSVSQNQVLTYVSGSTANAQLEWFDRSGKQISTIGEAAIFAQPSLSPDGTKLIAERMDSTPVKGISTL